MVETGWGLKLLIILSTLNAIGAWLLQKGTVFFSETDKSPIFFTDDLYFLVLLTYIMTNITLLDPQIKNKSHLTLNNILGLSIVILWPIIISYTYQSPEWGFLIIYAFIVHIFIIIELFVFITQDFLN